MSDITQSGCKLRWEPPEDDGGKPITGYVIEKMDKATGRWVPIAHTEPDVTDCQVRLSYSLPLMLIYPIL